MRTWIEISSSAFYHNIVHISSLLPASTSFGLVVKSNAYGHGIIPISQLAEVNDRIGWLCTAGIEEACILRKAGIKKPILVMAYQDASLALAIDYDISLTIYDSLSAYRIMQAARAVGKKAMVHIKVDTGLARLGVQPGDVHAIARMLFADEYISLQGIFTHLADTNSQDLAYTYRQLSLFEELVNTLKHAGITIRFVHALSSGALLLSGFSHNLVRVGTNAYGLWKSPLQKSRFLEHVSTFSLKPILSWFSYLQKIVRVGSLTVAYVPVGYADGYPKLLEGKVCVTLKNYQATVISVYEDYLVIDITSLPDLEKGCQVQLIGGIEKTSVTHVASLTGTINNEIAAGICQEIPRIVSF